ncbi:MAG: UDP-N-acetyl-D-glucosamine/UDP-N-acetyl-D-galactosamine dehydrogenase [Betaproteobacteria bacterium]|jgi:UDP-N-acetyl-D-galactosamine dehydrogenase|nr:UDP-N-acetyl-D-glucosamine/UDP-N-acetyl-D-galactosamine dehydrogenase [Betaproteobacteria bacterium]
MSGGAVVAVVGLGYVGLPLAVEFGKRFRTIAYDHSEERVEELRRGSDRTREVSAEELRAARLELTSSTRELALADFIIIAVPTPVDAANRPDLQHLVSASRAVGARLKQGAIVVYESTVYPGATVGVCVPELEAASGKKWKRDFFVGYSPERINPGDREHSLSRIVKVVSGDSAETLEKVAELYLSVVTAGVHRAPSIETAEAAKVIENTQRDLNIALMNELAIIFDRLRLDTRDVLAAAGTKWNFMPFKPGLVGGHCIGVDPYYLTYRAEMLGYHPQVILAGRRINDGMATFIADRVVKMIAATGRPLRGARINLLGLTFKENVPDLRNSKVADLHTQLAAFGVDLHVHDPLADPGEAHKEYGIRLESWDELPEADALILAVAHTAFVKRPMADFLAKVAANGCVIDVKSVLDLAAIERTGRACWRL